MSTAPVSLGHQPPVERQPLSGGTSPVSVLADRRPLPAWSMTNRADAHDVQLYGLHRWQREALDEWRRAKRRGIVRAVTGSGKTRLGLAAAAEAMKKGYKVVILVPTAELQGQWRRSIAQAIPQASVGSLGGEHRDSADTVDILVAIVHSAATRQLIKARRAGLLIADECHRYAARTFSAALQHDFGWRLGLTATLKRADQGDRTVLEPYFGQLVYRYGYEEALADKIIAPFDVALVGVELTASERSDYEYHSERISQLQPVLEAEIARRPDLATQEFFDAVKALAQDDALGKATVTAKSYLTSIRRRVGIAENAVAKRKALDTVAPVLGSETKALVFGESIESAEDAAIALGSQKIVARTVHSGQSSEDRRAALAAFRLGNVSVLCAPRVLDEGIDVPDAGIAVILSGTRTERQTIQRLGRVIRRKPHGAPGRLVYCYARNTLEDPAMHREFLPNILPFARAEATFDIPEQSAELVEFLSRPADPDDEDTDASVQPGTSDEFVIRWDHDDPGEWVSEARGTRIRTKVTSDGFKDYLKSMGRAELLTAEEEVQLAQEIEAGLYAQHILEDGTERPRRVVRELRTIAEAGMQSRDRFICANLRLVVSIAKKYRSRGTLELRDVVQIGNGGLIRAVQKFDYTQGSKFSTYATWWIRQAITRGIHDESRSIRLPVHVGEKVDRVNMVLGRREREGQDTADETIARETEMDAVTVRQLRSWAQVPLSVDGTYRVNGVVGTLSDFLVDHDAPSVPDIVAKNMKRTVLESVLDLLTEREAGVLARRCGLTTGEPQTLDAIGTVYGVTRERIRQIESKALGKLREPGFASLLSELY